MVIKPSILAVDYFLVSSYSHTSFLSFMTYLFRISLVGPHDSLHGSLSLR
jgi:hypothetical protein